MVRVKCPYCGKENKVAGLLQEIEPGEPTPFDDECVHFVFFSPTKYLGVEYAKQEFAVHFASVPEVYSLEGDIMRLLNTHFKFFGPVAFAPSEQARETARKEVADFLRARKFLN